MSEDRLAYLKLVIARNEDRIARLSKDPIYNHAVEILTSQTEGYKAEVAALEPPPPPEAESPPLAEVSEP